MTLTIKHQQERNGTCYATVTHSDFRTYYNTAITAYALGYEKPNYPMPAIRECPWCGSKHLGHSHWIADTGLIIPI